MSAEHHNYSIEAYLASGLLGVSCQLRLVAIGVTPKPVDVTTHNGAPSGRRGYFPDTGDARVTSKPVDATTRCTERMLRRVLRPDDGAVTPKSVEATTHNPLPERR